MVAALIMQAFISLARDLYNDNVTSPRHLAGIGPGSRDEVARYMRRVENSPRRRRIGTITTS